MRIYIHQNLCISGRACEHPEHVWRDDNGKIVESKEKVFESEYICAHKPGFSVECESNRSQTKDDQVYEGSCISAHRHPQQFFSTKDAHYSIQGITSNV